MHKNIRRGRGIQLAFRVPYRGQPVVRYQRQSRDHSRRHQKDHERQGLLDMWAGVLPDVSRWFLAWIAPCRAEGHLGWKAILWAIALRSKVCYGGQMYLGGQKRSLAWGLLEGIVVSHMCFTSFGSSSFLPSFHIWRYMMDEYLYCNVLLDTSVLKCTPSQALR